MQSTSVYLIEFYALLLIMNAFLGIVTTTYQEEDPTNSLRSPFTAFPLGSNFTSLDTATTTAELQAPLNGTGSPIAWFDDIYENFEAQISAVLTFVSFFTFGFITQLVETMGFPTEFMLILTAPLGLYLMYMTFVMITNRLGN
jgi:hypothetical protein